MSNEIEKHSVFSRRKFLHASLIGAAGTVLAACAPTETPTPETIIQEVEVEVEGETVIITATPAAVEAFEDFSGVTLEGIMRNSFIPEMNALQVNQAAFWGEQTGADVELNFSTEWRELVAAAVDSGAGGDIAELFANQAFIFSDALLDVSDIAEELAEEYGGWYDLGREACVVDGVWRALPRAYTAQAINYRTDVFEAAGVEIPTTYDELLNVSTIIFEQGLPPAGFTMNQAGPNDSANFAYSLLWSFGGAEVDEDGTTVAINSDATRAALEYMVELARVSAPDITAFDEGGNNRAFLGGEISMTQNATSIYWTALRDAYEVEEGVRLSDSMAHFPYPSGPAGRQEFVQMNPISILASTENPDASKAFLRYLMAEPQLAPLAQVGLTFYYPLLRHYDDLPSMPWNIDANLAPLKGSADGGHLAGWPGPASRESAAAYENQSIVNMFARVINGDDIEDAISTAEDELRSVYEA